MKTLIVTSFLVAFVLTVIPIAYDWRWCRPEFVVLLVIYWTMVTPQWFGLLAAWCVGLCLDLLMLSPLGFHAMVLLLISYISHLVERRIKNYVLWHQTIWVFILVGVFQLFSNWLGGFVGKSVDTPIYLITAFVSALMWPLLVVFLGRVLIYMRLLH